MVCGYQWQMCPPAFPLHTQPSLCGSFVIGNNQTSRCAANRFVNPISAIQFDQERCREIPGTWIIAVSYGLWLESAISLFLFFLSIAVFDFDSSPLSILIFEFWVVEGDGIGLVDYSNRCSMRELYIYIYWISNYVNCIH